MKLLPISQASFGSLLLSVLLATSITHLGRQSGAEPFDEGRLEKQILVPACVDPMGMDVLPDGRVLFIERPGHVKLYKPDAHKTVKLGTVPVAVFGEVGMLGLAADRDFARTGWVYLFFCPAERKETMRLSRFTVRGDKLDLKSEKKLLDYPIDIEGAIHMGGGMAMDPHGNLYVGTGDNCPPIDEVPIDRRPGKKIADALRSAGNTNDLRGKVLRIHPEPDGSYTIPKDNLFPDGKGGRPETYAMGCRNPFRIQIDPRTGWLYFGDVGCNVDVKFGSPGFDEINQARTAGNYGWPLFNGPNIPFRDYDFATKQLGPHWDVKNPVNNSPNNTGAKKLPPPIPAFIWYSTVPSKEFPEVGSGGRSAMAGPVYYYDPGLKSDVRLPAHFDRTFFFLEWMRNWVKAVKLDENGKIKRIDPFMGKENFRKPIDMKVGPEGALYVIEYGDKWEKNQDAQISRIIYRRGNRPPVAVVEASPTAGKHPLTVRFDGRRSFDKDPGDRLRYSWRLGGGAAIDSKEPTAKVTFDKPGTYRVELTVTDSHGATGTTQAEVRVGNAPPRVRIVEPADGGFFDWNEPVEYRVEVNDEEDGSTSDGKISSDRVTVQAGYQLRRLSVANPAAVDEASLHPGEALMRKSTCFSCHAAGDQSKGPPYNMVAQKYQKQSDARERLAKKVLEGGAGVWGSYPMPPHPQHTIEQTRLMVDWILMLTANRATPPMSGTEGGFTVMAPPEWTGGIGGIETGVYLIKATYTDKGAPGAAPLTGEATHVLHARRKKAAFSDTRQGVAVVHEVEGEGETGMVGRFSHGDYLSFAELNLKGIDRVKWRAGSLGKSGGTFTLRSDGPSGPVLAKLDIPAVTYKEYTVSVKDPGGVHNLYVVAEADPTAKDKSLSLNWIEFLDSPATAVARAKARAEASRRAEARKSLFKARPFVRNWTTADLAPSLKELGRGRSYERGKELFKTASCSSCHRMGKEGGNLGPDLTEVAQRMAKQPQPRLALLREVLEPSAVIDEKFRTHIVVTTDGKQHVGLVLAQNDKVVQMATNPAAPNEVVEIPRVRIEGMHQSAVSMMPAGLVSTLHKEEILDLLAYLEAGGELRSPAFQKKTTKILLIPTRLDHPYASHMYAHECRVLAKCLNQTPGVEATVSPDFDWPKDVNLLKEVKAIVYYSRPAGDIVLDPVRREQVQKLFKAGVGYAAIHWATDASPKYGAEYQNILGGWFHNSFGGLNTSKRDLMQVAPEHPVCRGWKPYVLRDEYYLKLKFHPMAQPILNVNVDGKDQVVAWAFNRPDSNGGRSFGCTLGHFHDNFEIEAFRRALVNGILWTAHVEVPRNGAPVALRPEDLKLPPKQ
jgi:cytochrome c